MTRKVSCDYCGQPLQDIRARFEVRMAPGLPEAGHRATGVFCNVTHWEAASAALKSVDENRERLHVDAETVLSNEHKITR